ncbi:HAD family hydrolase [Olsenella sp. Marseille-P4559]|uniref:HAD family hydrolase n=1 Tax=Olsenella sp. Marseille-P4559 TaxID=2364795 RepID=UPI0013EF1EAB|nr:HAD hydrolase family protein [Olsenella sp. Marseille-P4559]
MDQTFLGSDHKVPQANIEAIRQMRELGCLFVPASGRAYGSVMDSIATVPPPNSWRAPTSSVTTAAVSTA